MGTTEVEAFLTHLAVRGKVAASTQNQARSALLFLYKEALDQSRPGLENVDQAKRPQRLPVMLTHAEVKAVLDRLRHAFAHGRLRHPHGAETARPFGGLDHHDLHSPPQPGRQRCGQPAGQPIERPARNLALSRSPLRERETSGRAG